MTESMKFYNEDVNVIYDRQNFTAADNQINLRIMLLPLSRLTITKQEIPFAKFGRGTLCTFNDMTKTSSFLLTTFLLLFTTLLYGQKAQQINDNSEIASTENVRTFLEKNAKYPMECLRNNIAGDVVLSFDVNKQSMLDNTTLVISPNQYLSVSALSSMNELANAWHPFEDSVIQADKQYLIVFRYRMYMDVDPPSYARQAAKLVTKQKYEKALKLYNKAIEDNIYDGDLLAARSKAKKLLHDDKGAELDMQNAKRLQSEILTVINIEAIGMSREVNR